MTDVTRFFGTAVGATYPNGSPIIVSGKQLLIPQKWSLQTEIDAAIYANMVTGSPSVDIYFLGHYANGSSGDPQRQAGYQGGFDPRYTDAGNYSFGLSAAAAGFNLADSVSIAATVYSPGTGKSLPSANITAITQGYNDYNAGLFPSFNFSNGFNYVNAVSVPDKLNALSALGGTGYSFLERMFSSLLTTGADIGDAQAYAAQQFGANSAAAQQFIANYRNCSPCPWNGFRGPRR